MNTWLAIFIGGGLGSVLRFGISRLMMTIDLNTLPCATLSSNILSTIILGWVLAKGIGQESTWYFLLVVGFCGGFSTFSTFSNETFLLAKNGQLAWAVVNVLLSVSLCLFILFLISKTAK